MLTLMQTTLKTVNLQYNALSESVSSDGYLKIAKSLDNMDTRPRQDMKSKTLLYSKYNHDRPETRSLLFLLSRLARFNLFNANAWAALHEMCMLTFAWRPRRQPPRPWKLLIHIDELEDLALYHMRAGMVSVLGGL